LKDLQANGLDETASKQGHNYITVPIDQDCSDTPVIFAVPGKGMECLTMFDAFIEVHKGRQETSSKWSLTFRLLSFPPSNRSSSLPR
jgi:hypothetical protein